MILIITEERDFVSQNVIDWLIFSKHDYLIINQNSKVKFLKAEISVNKLDLQIQIDSKIINLSEVKSIWYRRHDFYLEHEYKNYSNSNSPIEDFIVDNLDAEVKDLENYIRILINEFKYKIGDVKFSNINKLNVLQKAKQIGFSIPSTFICNTKKELLKIDKDIITKSIQEGIMFTHENINYTTYTEYVNERAKSKLPDSFFHSLLQEKINKKYELRIFFYNDNYFPMAIFSQNDEQTKVDFRKYNLKIPNRFIPFSLPSIVLQKLKKLMDTLKLSTGSIDLVVDINDVYYFLEVNPVGQFGMVSSPCNYNIEKKLVNTLLRN